MDVDKDGLIGIEDIKTCLRNINSTAFFKNGGEALSAPQFSSTYKFYPTTMNEEISDEKLLKMCQQIREAMTKSKVSMISLFQRCDTQDSGMINLGQFLTGITSIIPIAAPLLEKLFNVMDSNSIGMVDFQRF